MLKREILDGMSEYRIDPTLIKIKENAPNIEGGQGVVVVGTFRASARAKKTVSVDFVEHGMDEEGVRKLAADRRMDLKVLVEQESKRSSTEELKEILNDLRQTTDMPAVHTEGQEEQLPERTVTIKILGWNQDDLQESTKFFKLNILVNSSYRAVITDFGSARIRRNVASKERENQSPLPGDPLVYDDLAAAGTSPEVKFNPSTREFTLTGPKFSLRWTAPEVLAGEDQDFPSDMWAMGWICWEMVTGRIPFDELHQETTIVVRTTMGNLPAIRENIDLSHVLKLCSLMSECWASQPAKRIDASAFQQRVRIMPSETPSSNAGEGHKTRSARLLMELGQMYGLQDNHQEAEFHYQLAVDVATRTRDEAAKANALIHLGQMYNSQSKLSEAERALVEAQDIHSRIGNNQGVADALKGLGHVYRARSKDREAEKALMEAHEMYSLIGHNLGAAQALLGLGDIYSAHSKNDEAGKTFTKAYEMLLLVGDDLGAAHALEGLGEVYWAQSSYGEAERAFTDAHEIHSRIGNHVGIANAYLGLGKTYSAQSMHGKAEKALITAHETHSRIGDQ
ncbi:hypothetical protein FRC00_010821, partial [Tulasnella sp. 408]